MADFHLTRLVIIHSLFPKKGKKRQCRFQKKPSFKFTFLQPTQFSRCREILKRYDLNNDCYSLHSLHLSGKPPSSWSCFFKCSETRNLTFQSKKQNDKSSIFRRSKIAKIACTDLQRTSFVFFTYKLVVQFSFQLCKPCHFNFYLFLFIF